MCWANTIGPAIRTPPIAEAQRKAKNQQKLVIGAMNSPCFTYRHGEYSRFVHKPKG
jgi:hypothetical protein